MWSSAVSLFHDKSNDLWYISKFGHYTRFNLAYCNANVKYTTTEDNKKHSCTSHKDFSGNQTRKAGLSTAPIVCKIWIVAKECCSLPVNEFLL